jgi:hypothetical protein
MSKPSPFGLQPFHHFFMEYGTFLGSWSSFEVLIEVALMRELRLSLDEACITFASVGSGARFNILYSLLSRRPQEAHKVAIISEAVDIAERNGFAHGFISVSPDGTNFTLVRRDIKKTLTVRPKTMTALQMQRHGHMFYGKFEEAQRAFGITDYDLIQYQRGVELLAKTPQAPSPAKALSAASFREAKRALKRERRALAKARIREP